MTENDKVKISIANNGPMIPDEIRTRIFEKFFTTKAAKNGSGLGLSTVRSTLEDHDATMELDSNLEWTTFTFIFKRLAFKSNKKNTVEIELL